jgi:hypothetical protein
MYTYFSTFAILLLPFVVSASHIPGHIAGHNFAWFVGEIINLIELFIVFIFALTFLAIIWGVIKYWIIQGGEPESVESGKKIVFAGIIGLVVMVSIWGIIYLLKSSFFNF